MVHYFGTLAILVVPALLATAATGIFRPGPTHLAIGLFSAIFAVATHTLMIVFMIVTGRVLKAAMRSRSLDERYLRELNAFFSRKSSYPAAVLAATAVVATGVLGYAQRGFGISPAIHMLVGLGALVLNLWALSVEYRTLRENQSLLDRTAEELDRLDREDRERGIESEPEEGLEPFRFPPAQRWAIAALAAWAPMAYWGLVVWRGDFARLSPMFLWGTVFASGFCLISAWLLRGADAADGSTSPN